jgi:DNA-nicking Smr family endonuclease
LHNKQAIDEANDGEVTKKIDLHNQTQQTATIILLKKLVLKKSIPDKLKIIVGKGKHSFSQVLGPMVEKFLINHGFNFKSDETKSVFT